MDGKSDAEKIITMGYTAANLCENQIYELILSMQEVILSRMESENLPVTRDINRIAYNMTPEYILAMQTALEQMGILILQSRIKAEFEARKLTRAKDAAVNGGLR